jgi:predicted dithiol-disulfide oxidoreductase (DUF899 family)
MSVVSSAIGTSARVAIRGDVPHAADSWSRSDLGSGLYPFTDDEDDHWPTYARERPGMSVFALEDGVVYHTYSTYARGLDALWGMYQWLDRAPLGRNEERTEGDPLNFYRRHDEYDSE